MISASPELIALLNGSDTFLMCDLYTITTKAGVVLRIASADIDIVANGFTFLSGLNISRGTIRISTGITVDTLDVTIYPSLTDLVGNVPFVQAVRMGLLDGADFKLERAFFSDWQTFVGSLIRFTGRISEIQGYTRTEIPISVKSHMELLSINLPRNIYQPGCRWSLYDTSCGVVRATYTQSAAVAANAGNSTSVIFFSSTDPSGSATLGTVTFTSGENNGVTRNIKQHSQSGGVASLTLSLPLDYLPAVGDTFTYYHGCDKTLDACKNKYNNFNRFGGEPFIPAAETAY